MLDLVFPCFSVNFHVFGDPKLAMEVENLKSGGLYHLGGLKNKDLNNKISFSILPHFTSYYSSYFQPSSHLKLRPNPSKHLCALIENFKLYGEKDTTRISKASHIHWSNF